jgi:hypothetical protein
LAGCNFSWHVISPWLGRGRRGGKCLLLNSLSSPHSSASQKMRRRPPHTHTHNLKRGHVTIVLAVTWLWFNRYLAVVHGGTCPRFMLLLGNGPWCRVARFLGNVVMVHAITCPSFILSCGHRRE